MSASTVRYLPFDFAPVVQRIANRKSARLGSKITFVVCADSSRGAQTRSRNWHHPKKRAGRRALLEKLCRPCFPAIFMELIERATLLLRVRAPPETWTTRAASRQSEAKIGRPSSSSCHLFRQRLFKIPAICVMIGNEPLWIASACIGLHGGIIVSDLMPSNRAKSPRRPSLFSQALGFSPASPGL
jgi:hypothetical protein